LERNERVVENEKELAEAHWKFLARWMKMVYIDAFIHGYKHGKEARKK
jgi:hypothetical protein